MRIHAILTSAPVNGVAASALSQKGCEPDRPLDRDELKQIVARLERKLRLLKLVLGINSKAKRKNLLWKMNKGLGNSRCRKEPRAAIEYHRVGIEIQRMQRRMAEIKAAAT